MEYAIDKLLSSPSSAVFHTDLSLFPELVKLHDIPIYSCFALMLAFNEPLSLVRYWPTGR